MLGKERVMLGKERVMLLIKSEGEWGAVTRRKDAGWVDSDGG